MADLSSTQAASTTKLVGATSTGTETNVVNATVNGDLNSVDGLNSGGVEGNLNLVTAGTAYEAKVGVSRLVNRKSLTITALDDMFWGYNSTVTSSSGTPLKKDQQLVFSINPNSSAFQIWLVASANNKNARITESP